MKFLLSTSAGLEALAKKEIQKQGGIIEQVFDRVIIFSGAEELMVRVNLWSRVGNKLYLIVAEKSHVTDFDSLFDVVYSADWSHIRKKDFPIIVKAKSVKSELFSEKALQSLTKKAIVKKIAGNQGLQENEDLQKMEVLTLCLENSVYILLNTSGAALHKRGYRKDSGEAPIKENLVAGIVLLSNWRFSEPFYDVFCGSGTIPIEALMIAKNIAPGLQRSFAFEDFELISQNTVEAEKKQAQEKQFTGKYNIFASDIDQEALEIAEQNAKNAGLQGEIVFEQKDISDVQAGELSGTLVSNPPYGERLAPENLESLYIQISNIFRKNKELNGGIISSFMGFDTMIDQKMYKKRKLYNGGEKCYFWKRIKK